MPTVTPSKRFEKAMKKLTQPKAEDAENALVQFIANPSHPGLNFEKVQGTKKHHTIRTNGGDRICLRKVSKGAYEAVDVGEHDYIYRTYG